MLKLHGTADQLLAIAKQDDGLVLGDKVFDDAPASIDQPLVGHVSRQHDLHAHFEIDTIWNLRDLARCVIKQ